MLAQLCCHTVVPSFPVPSVCYFVYIVDRKGPTPGRVPLDLTNPPVGVMSACDHNDLIFEEGELLGTDRSAVH